MPTPRLYQLPGGQAVFNLPKVARPTPDLDLFFITDRAPDTLPESTLSYGQERSGRIVFGSTQVRLVPEIDWQTLRTQSQLAERTQEIDLELGTVRELEAFPHEPYQLHRGADGLILRDRDALECHAEAKGRFQSEIQRRLGSAPKKEVMLYVHGFNETFASAAFTTAELCHFLGREQVCGFFTWPASSTGNFLISYATTTESADYAVVHLKKTIRMLSTTPGLDNIQLIAHSRGTALMLAAVRELALEAISAGKEPLDLYKIDNLVLLSPDIDMDIAGQQVASLLSGFRSDPDLVTVRPQARLPRILKGRLTIYASPDDRALLAPKILFRSRSRVGQLRIEDIPPRIQRYHQTLGKVDLISYQGERTDLFGHLYFTTNPKVSSDLIQMIRYAKPLGGPGRQLNRTGPVSWEFPVEATAKRD